MMMADLQNGGVADNKWNRDLAQFYFITHRHHRRRRRHHQHYNKTVFGFIIMLTPT